MQDYLTVQVLRERVRLRCYFNLDRMKDCKEFLASFTTLIKATAPKTPPRIFEDNTDLSLWIRMLYSCLVDADFLDTEAYMDLDKATERGGYCSVQELLEAVS